MQEFKMGRGLLLPCLVLWSATAWAQADYDSLKSQCRAGSDVDCVGLGAIANEKCEDGVESACKDLIALAKEGWPDAQYRLGTAYVAGWGFRPSLEQGKLWLQEAANQGHIWAEQWFKHNPAAIDGAFGFKLGAPFTPPPGATAERTAEGLRYVVKATKPVHPFTEYSVVTTPKTGLIHTIEAEVELQKYPAQQQFAYAHLRLQKEFWTQPQETRRIYQAQVDFVSQEGRTVRLSCKFHTVYVVYADSYLREQGLAESRQ
jgi:TPR repeat protein